MSLVWTTSRNKFLTAEGVKGNEIHKHLCVVYGGNAMNRANVYKWIQFFKGGRTEVHNEEWNGQPPESVNKETVSIVCTLMVEDRRSTLTDLYREVATRYSYIKFG